MKLHNELPECFISIQQKILSINLLYEDSEGEWTTYSGSEFQALTFLHAERVKCSINSTVPFLDLLIHKEWLLLLYV